MEKAKSCVTFCRPRRLAAILAGALLLGSADTLAEERRNFLGETITVEPGRFFVTADVNVRAKPTANSEKVGRFGKGRKSKSSGGSINSGTRWKRMAKTLASSMRRS